MLEDMPSLLGFNFVTSAVLDGLTLIDHLLPNRQEPFQLLHFHQGPLATLQRAASLVVRSGSQAVAFSAIIGDDQHVCFGGERPVRDDGHVATQPWNSARTQEGSRLSLIHI